MELGHCNVGGLRGEFAGVVDLISTRSYSDSIGVLFLWMICDDNFCVVWWLIFGDIRYVLWIHDKKCIGSFCLCFVVALTHSAKIFAESRHPNFRRSRVLHKLTVACDMLASDWMDHGHAVVFKVLTRVDQTKAGRSESFGMSAGVVDDKTIDGFLDY